MTLKTTLGAALTALSLITAAPALAAETDVTPTEIVAADVTDMQVDAFVEALIAVEAVRREYTPLIQGEEAAAARNDLIAEADKAAKQAVADVENISVADYLGIGNAAQKDKALNERIAARIKAAQAE